MAKFKFKLQSFLNLKEKLEDQKKLEYGKAIKELELEKRVKEQLISEKNHLIKSFKESINIKISPIELQRYNVYIDLLKKKINEQVKRIKLAEKKVEEKRVELVEAVKERKMLETLYEKEKVEYHKEELLAEQKTLDEIVSFKYNNR